MRRNLIEFVQQCLIFVDRDCVEDTLLECAKTGDVIIKEEGFRWCPFFFAFLQGVFFVEVAAFVMAKDFDFEKDQMNENRKNHKRNVKNGILIRFYVNVVQPVKNRFEIPTTVTQDGFIFCFY